MLIFYLFSTLVSYGASKGDNFSIDYLSIYLSTWMGRAGCGERQFFFLLLIYASLSPRLSLMFMAASSLAR